MTRRAFAPEIVFLTIGAMAGVLFIVVTPPLRGADESAHWYRAYQVSEGRLVAERRQDRVGGFLPKSLRITADDRPWRGAQASLRADERAFLDFRNTALYAPLPYLPQAIAIAAWRGVGVPPLTLFYLARAAGLAAALTLTLLAIRVTPLGKWTFLLLALTPMAIRQMSLVTADSVTHAACLLFIGLCLRIALVQGTRGETESTAVLGLGAFVVALSKIAYAPLSLLALLPQTEGDGARRAGWLRAGVAIALGVAGIAAWLWLIRDLYAAQRIAPDADPGRQLAFILVDPVSYGYVLLADVADNGVKYVWQGLGYEWTFPTALAWPHLGVLIVVAILDGRGEAGLGRWTRGLLAVVAVATYVLITTMNYLAWSPIGAASVSFVQGRYYIPIVPLLLLLLSSRRLASVVPVWRLAAGATAAAVVFAGIAVANLLLLFHR